MLNINKIFQKKSAFYLVAVVIIFLFYQFIPSKFDKLNQSNINAVNNNINTEENIIDDETENEPIGFTGIKDMNVCKGSSDICYTRQVEFENGEVIIIYFPDNKSINIDYSDCQDNYCYVEDEDGGEWDLVE